MKHCPNCRTQYTDDTLKFCLQDGSPLIESSVSAMNTAEFGETETVISNRPPSRVSVDYQTQNDENNLPRTTNSTFSAQAPAKSRTALTIAATILAMLLLFAGIGIGTWLYLKNNRTEIAKNTNSVTNSINQNVNKNTNSANDNKKFPSPTPKTSPTANIANSNSSNTTNLSPSETAQVKKEVAETVEGWRSAIEEQNLDAQMDKYADTVDYYNKKGANLDFIRKDKQRAFDQYDSINLTISNLSVMPDASGKRAIAVFDKKWDFENEEKSSNGKVKSQLNLANVGGEWRITGEKDIKNYAKE